MDCYRAREAISALIDGEDPGVADDALQAHLAACQGCRAWQQRAHAVTRRARLGGSLLDHDLTARVLAGVPSAPAPQMRLARRAGLVAVAMAQLAVTVPLLIWGHDHDAGAHAAHELGSFDLALAIAFIVGAIRPVLSAGLAWPSGVAAAGLAGTAIADLVSGQTIGADEAQHLIAVCGAALLFWQARADGARGPVPARAVRPTDPGIGAAAAAPVAVSWLDSPPEPADGGTDAARGTAPDIAARQLATAQPDGSGERGSPRERQRTQRPGREGDSTEAVA
jgi:predicted anti-sigma-YlaC factor YlaD